MSDPTTNSHLAHREAIKDQARPTQLAGLDTAGLKDKVREVQEIQDTFRVMAKVWTVQASGDTPDDPEITRAKAKFDGRVEPDDFRIVEDKFGRHKVEVRLWTIHSEWKEEADVIEAQKELNGHLDYPETEIVSRNSKAEHDLKNYGVKKLAASRRGKTTTEEA